uniref:Peptidyl-prolyl cis-trans isomerase, cyclophilin-type family protein n=1 Tax=Babesia bovis TaxID=5865 RepID=A7AUH3_BABBO|eukprot:XP_001610152.1 peptidyl-prolyl cis-trans isomerase, cyclophilin-type family protein [Babesia bovis T2Bo]
MSEVYTLEPPCRGRVILHTSEGELDVRLWSSQCPLAVRNFVQLCLEGYYNNCIFHRIIPQFMVQTGDPTGTGHGGESIYGECFENEIVSRLKFRYRGLVGMANTGGKRTNGSQFFITLERADCLNGKYTLFGKIEGNTVYNLIKIGQSEVNPNTDRPKNPPRITHVEVVNNPFPDIQPRLIAHSELTDEEDVPVKPAPSAVKKKCLLSFDDGGYSDEEKATVALPRVKSAHELLSDPKLSRESVTVEHVSEPSEDEGSSSDHSVDMPVPVEQGTANDRKREIALLESELRRGDKVGIVGHDGVKYLTRKEQRKSGSKTDTMARFTQFTKRLSEISRNTSLLSKEGTETDEGTFV